MNFTEILFIAIGLAMDALAVSVSNGITLKKIKVKYALKFGLFFGVFQFIMPIIGWFCAKNFKNAIENFDHWVAFILLLIIGGKMFLESFKTEKENVTNNKNILSFYNMTILAIATSIDALAIGVSFAFLNNSQETLDIWQSSAIIGIVAFTMSYAGVYLGKKIGGLIEKNAERTGGVILIGIGVKILIEHLF
ncbi:MAG: manganese efflux pump [Clostridiales bacterium]|nr:manganese efflux pump [Clostridiales bacterium]